MADGRLSGFKFKRGTKVPGDPTCIVDHAQMYSPVEGCDQCVEDTTKVMCGTRTEINDSLQKQFECVCQTSTVHELVGLYKHACVGLVT